MTDDGAFGGTVSVQCGARERGCTLLRQRALQNQQRPYIGEESGSKRIEGLRKGEATVRRLRSAEH